MSGGGTFPLKILDEPMAMETRRLDGAFEKWAIMEVRSSRMKSGSQKNFTRPLLRQDHKEELSRSPMHTNGQDGETTAATQQ